MQTRFSVLIQEVDFLKYVPVLKNLEVRYIRGDKFFLIIDTPKLRVVIVGLINPFNRSHFKINYILIPTYLYKIKMWPNYRLRFLFKIGTYL